MENEAKIHLSKDESDLVTNTEWILTKHRITKKVFELFEELNEMMKKEIIIYHHIFPENIKHQNGKIAKGENYQLLPYVMLDYPSFFWKDNIFALRTMFWWGNFFSVTLHLSGRHKSKFINNNPEILTFLKEKKFFICINNKEWEHDFSGDNYTAASDVSLLQYKNILDKDFFKISKKISIEKWSVAGSFIMESFYEIIEFLQINYQGDKINLLPAFPKAGSGL